MPDNIPLTPKEFTDSVAPLLDRLNKTYADNKLYISDIRDGLERQCVDLVQEGGGVYGIALAGYTYILEKMNIAFIKMAGTSAGSVNTMLLSAVYTKEEARFLNLDPAPYYDTRSEKVLEYLAKKNLGDIVDGHPFWRKIILGIFNNPNGVKILGRQFKRWGIFLLVTFLLFILVAILSLYLTFRCCNPGLLRWSNIATWILLAVILIFSIGFVGKGILFRFLYRHAERLGINPGDDFLNWIRDILKENKVDTLKQLKDKLNTEIQFKADYKPPESEQLKQLVTPPATLPDPNKVTSYADLETILILIQNNSISLDFICDQLNHIYNLNVTDATIETMPDLVQLNKDMPRIVEAFEKRTLNARTKGISGPGTITRELVMVTSDLTNEIKVEFPGMHRMYWGDDDTISPANYVRASMSVPFFFKPFRVNYNPKEMHAIRREWNKYTKVYKNLGEYALFIDGGILSNFPINVFNDPTIPLPRKPTLGIKLEYNDESTSDPINDLVAFCSKMVSTMRFFYDRDFLIKNESYRKTVRSVDTGKISWLNFGLSDQQKIELFFRGALAATIFLSGSQIDDAATKDLCDLGNNIPFTKADNGHFSMYKDKSECFECAELDKLLGNVRFNWEVYKEDRIRSLLAHPIQKQNLKTQAS